MRQLLPILLAFAAVLPCAAEDGPVSFEALVAKMSAGGKRSFQYQESVAGRFAERRVHGDTAALDGPKAYEAGLELLKTAGLAAVPLASGAIRIVTTEQAPKEALRVVNTAEELPASEEFCSLAVTLRHARVRDLLAPMQALISDPRNVVVAESTNSLVVSDYASNLRKLAGLIARMDAGGEAGTWRIMVAVLEGADADAVSAPKGFDGAKLAEATGRESFTLLGDGMATLAVGGMSPDRGPLARAAIRLWGGGPLGVQMTVTASADGGLTFEELKVAGEAEEGKEQPVMLQTKFSVKDTGWTIAGTLPVAGKDGKCRAVLIRVEAAK